MRMLNPKISMKVMPRIGSKRTNNFTMRPVRFASDREPFLIPVVSRERKETCLARCQLRRYGGQQPRAPRTAFPYARESGRQRRRVDVRAVLQLAVGVESHRSLE